MHPSWSTVVSGRVEAGINRSVGRYSVKRFERSNRLDTELHKNHTFCTTRPIPARCNQTVWDEIFIVPQSGTNQPVIIDAFLHPLVMTKTLNYLKLYSLW